MRIGAAEHILAPGDVFEGNVYASHNIAVSEVPQGTKAALAGQTEDFPLGKACDLSGDTACEACQQWMVSASRSTRVGTTDPPVQFAGPSCQGDTMVNAQGDAPHGVWGTGSRNAVTQGNA